MQGLQAQKRMCGGPPHPNGASRALPAALAIGEGHDCAAILPASPGAQPRGCPSVLLLRILEGADAVDIFIHLCLNAPVLHNDG